MGVNAELETQRTHNRHALCMLHEHNASELGFLESFSNSMLKSKLSELSSSTFVTCGCHNADFQYDDLHHQIIWSSYGHELPLLSASQNSD
jgi:hypothetical protein